MPYQFTEEELHFRKLLFTKCNTMEELDDWITFFLEIQLPSSHVDPDSNYSPLEMCWDIYQAIVFGREDETTQFLAYACRFGGKTLTQSITEVLLLLHFKGNICHLASIEEQSKNCQNYLKNWFSLPYLRDFVEGDNKRETSALFYVPINGEGVNLSKAEWKTLSWEEQQQYKQVINKVEVIVATRQSVNGKHSVLLCLDELDLLERPGVISEAVNIPTPVYRDNGSIALPAILYTSTRKSAFGPVQNCINNAEERGIRVRHFNILDVTEACPASRHRPDLPKLTVYRSDGLLSAVSEEKYRALPNSDQKLYERDTCYWGCLNNCKLFAACRGHLATRQTARPSKFLKPISYVTAQFRANSTETAISQLLCRKPSSEGLVYPRLDKDRHVLTPAQAYERIFGETCLNQHLSKEDFVKLIDGKGDWCGALDWGFSHNFAYVQGMDINNCMYVIYAFAAAELERSQQFEEMERFKKFEPIIWPDKEDPMAIKEFKRAGFRLKDWKKTPGSVVGGINIVRKKLNPPLGQPPELFFIRDVGEDPHIDLLLLHLQEHHWKLDAAGTPTDNVSDTNKDLPDALRYMVMNRYPAKGAITIVQEDPPKQKLIDIDGNRVYKEETWMTQRISELTGQEERPPATSRPPMVVETFEDYYKKSNEEDKKDRSGKHRGIIWNFD